MGEERKTPYFGDFVLFGEIGRGGMGIVYRAQQTKLDRTVALKVMHSAAAAGETGIQRFHLEAEAAAKLEHPNIVPIFEFGEHDGHPYLAMQLVEGESLAEYITRLGSGVTEREAASLMEKIARAVQHAHERGVLHRDLKPGNVLLDEDGEPHLIDFGLAKWIEQDSGMTLTGAFLGTPAYASPEQILGQRRMITTASDIYSLGAILYALLTGRAPVVGDSIPEIIENSKNSFPRRPRALRPEISKDLEVICLKCLEKEPSHRYVSAGELAGDIKRFLEGLPIMARSVGALERFWMWLRRHPVHAGLWVMGVLLFLTVMVGLFVMRGYGARILKGQLALEQSRTVRLMTHSAGWSSQAWSNIVNAARQTEADRADLRNEAAALLAGLDASRIVGLTNFRASSVRFGEGGNLLLMGGVEDGGKLYEESRGIISTNSRIGLGPVGVMADGTPVQLSIESEGRLLVLSGVLDDRVRREWQLPVRVEGEEVLVGRLTYVALSRDSAKVAAVLELSDGRQVAVVSKEASFQVLGILEAPATALGLSEKGELVGVAASDRTVSVWVTQTGERLPPVELGRNKVLCLAFSRPTHVASNRTNLHLQNWVMATGDAGGTVTLWDILPRKERAHFPGGYYEVTALGFSPDGVTLASAGIGPVKVWDIPTEHLLLNIEAFASGGQVTGLDFTRDGTRLAMSNRGGNLHSPHVQIWKFEFGRGIRTIRGLSGQISRISFSSDGSKLAAMSHHWEVGVWNLADGRLIRIFELPDGVSADNAALAFSPDGNHLAFSAGGTAKLWEISSGSEQDSWQYPRGLNDCLGFPDPRHFRLLSREGETNPVVRLWERDLVNHRERPIAELREFSHVDGAASSPNGQFFVVEGEALEQGRWHRYIKAFDGFSGKSCWRIDSERTDAFTLLPASPADELVALRTNAVKDDALLVELSTGRPIAKLQTVPSAVSSKSGLYAVITGDIRQVNIFSMTNTPPLISLGVESELSNAAQFDSTGDQLAWGNGDGTIMVCNLKEVRERLRRVGLQWR